MEYRKLGRTDLLVSSVGLGTMTWGEQNTEAEGHAQMDYAVDHGINLFDTAELYPIPRKRETQGRTDEIIGSWLRARGNRDRFVIASKVVGRSDADWFRDGGVTTDLSRAQVLEAVDKGLKRLGTDWIDLYQVHWPDRPVSAFGSVPTVFRPKDGPEVPIEETLDALGEAVKAGKIRYVGLSNESPWGTMTYLHHAETKGLPRVQSIQNAYSLLNRTFETGLAEIAMRESVGLLAYSTLGQGTLTGKYLNGLRPEKARIPLFERFVRYSNPQAQKACARYVQLARDHGMDPAQMALAFVTRQPFVTSNIIGATNMDQLNRNLSSINMGLTDSVLKAISEIHQSQPNPAP